MKILINHKDSSCFNCGNKEVATLYEDGSIQCAFCGSENILDKVGGHIFIPKLITNRRNPTRKWHSHHLRRSSDIAYGGAL